MRSSYTKNGKRIRGIGLELKPHYPCVAKNMLNGSQMIVVWHVDHLKVSHVNNFKITEFACYLDEIYGGLSVKIVKLNNYLGVDLYFFIDRKVQVYMIPYLNNILRNFPENFGTTNTSPDVDHLFKVQSEEESRPLPE